MMHFVDFKQPGPPDVLFINEGSKPTPKPDEVLICVKAAGINRPDLLQREGRYPLPAGASPILGLEVSGIVEDVGSDVSDWRVGDKVCALTNGGGYAEYCSAPATQVLALPQNMSFVEAAAIPETYFTVWGNLFMRSHLDPGETILVHSGSSGIGACVIQLSLAFGAHPITTAGSKEKKAFCERLGAKRVIEYNEEDFLEVLGENSVDVIFDFVGGDYFEKHLVLLKEEGRLIQIGCMGGRHSSINLHKFYQKRLTLVGSTLRAQSKEQKAAIASALRKKVWPLFEQKKLKPSVLKTFPLSEASQAHAFLESREVMGKLVLDLQGEKK